MVCPNALHNFNRNIQLKNVNLCIRTIARYCKSKNFLENFIFVNSAKRYIWDIKNLRLGHDLPRSVNDRVISAFRKDFVFMNFAYTKFHENKTLAKISQFTVVHYDTDSLVYLSTYILADGNNA